MTTNWILGGVISGALLASVGAQAQSTAPAQDELRLGVHSVTSGPGAFLGSALVAAGNFVAEDWNAKGGLPVGDKKYHIKVITYDDQMKPTIAVSVINRLIFEDKVKFVLGPWASPAVVAVLPISTQNKVMTMLGAFTGVAMKPEYPYTFRATVTPAEFAEPVLTWIHKKTGLKKMALLGPNNESGQLFERVNEPALKKMGVEVIKESYEDGRTDFVPILTRLMAANVDAIDVTGSVPGPAALIVKQARELGYKGYLLQSGTGVPSQIISLAGKESAEGFYTYIVYDPDEPAMKSLADRVRKQFNSEMAPFTPALYAGAQMMMAAIQKSGKIDDADAVAKILGGMGSFDSSVGKVVVYDGDKYDGVHRQLITPYFIGQVVDGKVKIVARCAGSVCN